MASWVLVPCQRTRLGELKRLLTSLEHPAKNVVVVTTLPDPIRKGDLDGLSEHLLTYERPGKRFGEWFNMGFDYLAGPGEYEVMCVGSSHVGASHTVGMLAATMRLHGLAMVGPDLSPDSQLGPGAVAKLGDNRKDWLRVPPECFMVPGELGLRFDPEFRWHYSDDDFEMQAREVGPVGLVGGAGFVRSPNHPLDAEQEQHAYEDRGKFMAKWGPEWLAHR